MPGEPKTEQAAPVPEPRATEVSQSRGPTPGPGGSAVLEERGDGEMRVWDRLVGSLKAWKSALFPPRGQQGLQVPDVYVREY